MTQTIIVTLEIEVPAEATQKDINDYVDVELAGVNSMKLDNPCDGNAEVVSHQWKYE